MQKWELYGRIPVQLQAVTENKKEEKDERAVNSR